jgi:hypothetical protein
MPPPVVQQTSPEGQVEALPLHAREVPMQEPAAVHIGPPPPPPPSPPPPPMPMQQTSPALHVTPIPHPTPPPLEVPPDDPPDDPPEDPPDDPPEDPPDEPELDVWPPSFL